jgi:thiol-disulfide isomerase/thioredoxin
MKRCLVGAALLVLVSCGPAERNGEEKSEPAPPTVELKAVHHFNGNVTRLADVKGKVVLVDFWAIWCQPCILAFPHLSDLHRRFHQDGLEVVGVTTYFASDFTPEAEGKAIEQFVAKHKLPYPILMISQAEWKRALRDYAADGIPMMVLLDRNGDVQGRWQGFSPTRMEVIEAAVEKLVSKK